MFLAAPVLVVRDDVGVELGPFAQEFCPVVAGEPVAVGALLGWGVRAVEQGEVPEVGVDFDRPNAARMYDYMLRGAWCA